MPEQEMTLMDALALFESGLLTYKEQVGSRIQNARHAAGMTCTELAFSVGLAPQLMHAVESNLAPLADSTLLLIQDRLKLPRFSLVPPNREELLKLLSVVAAGYGAAAERLEALGFEMLEDGSWAIAENGNES